MRVALCLSGEPRFFKETYPNIKRHLIDPFNSDVFLHTWRTPEDYTVKYSSKDYNQGWNGFKLNIQACDDVCKLYGATSHYIDNSKDFFQDVDTDEMYRRYFNYYTSEFKQINLRGSLCMFYSILKSNLLKREFELINRFQYDWVIRCRFDLLINQTPDLANLDNSKVYYEEMGQPDNMVSDWFNFGSSDNMNVYSSVFPLWKNLIDRQLKRHGRWCNELLIKEILDTFEIGYSPVRLGLALPRL